MDSSASKRRKTSPTESVPVESTTPPGPPPPQQEEQLQPQQQLQLRPSRSPQRPSVASPTTSSLARHNPEILNRRRDTVSRRSDHLPASRPTTPDENPEVETAPAASSERQPEEDGSGPSPSGQVALSSSAAPDTRAAPHAIQQGAPRSPVRRVGGSTLGAQLPRRTPTRPQPRPLPPPDHTDREEEIVNPFLGRALRRSPTNTGVIPALAREEPSLPPTPQHPDPVVSTPPSGIHNTPSKRRRDETEREAVQGTSFSMKKLPSQEARPKKPQFHRAGVNEIARRGSPVRIVQGIQAPLPQPVPSDDQPNKGLAPGTHPRRSVRLRGPDWENAQKRDALLQEIAQLEADLELARGEHEIAIKGSPSSSDPDVLLDLLRRHLLPPEKGPEPDPSARWIEAAMDPFAMLGFNGQSSVRLPPFIPANGSEEKSQPPVISHHPVAMTAFEELPYLQVFTPLSFTSKMTTMPSNPDQHNQNTLQNYTIDVRSASPPGLFTARIQMIVNTRNQAIASLAVPRLDPAAASELRPFIDLTTNTNTPYHPALTRNISILCFAMAEWFRVALKRAKFWHALDKEFGPENKDGFANAVAVMRTRKKRRRRAREASETESDAAEGLEGSNSLGSLDGMMLSKKELLPHMGRTSMDLEVPYLAGDHDADKSEIRVSWGVEFDWAGVAKNNLAVEVGVPGKWQAVDARKSIVGIPKLFSKLLQGGEDPLTAVKTVVALLAGEPTS